MFFCHFKRRVNQSFLQVCNIKKKAKKADKNKKVKEVHDFDFERIKKLSRE